MTKKITIPYNFKPREYQLPLLKAIDNGYKRAVAVWHRRCLAKDTKIALANGSFKNIQDILPGETVLSYNGTELEPKTVLSVYHNGFQKVNKYNDLVATPNHNIFSEGRWCEIERARSLTNAFDNFRQEKIVKEDCTEEVATYDLQIEDNHNYIANGYIVHNSGKDKTLINLMAKKAFERKGVYFYLLPTFAQAKRILWDGIDGSGFRFLDHFPKEIVQSKNSTELKINLVNGSIIQLVGTDNIDNLMGTNPVGCVFSEYSLQNPNGWDLIRPILAENDGWAVFNFTPRGRNHGYKIAEMAKRSDDWFFQILSVNDTKKEDGSPVISPVDIQFERESGMSEELIQQEFYVSFDTGVEGNYYARALSEIESQITTVPYDPMLPVITSWDLGVGDATAIWFFQTLRSGEIRVIDYYEASGEGLPYYAKYLKEKPYIYDYHIMPHDIQVKELGSGRSRFEMAQELGIRPIEIAPKLSIDDGINAVRAIIPKCWFDKTKCFQGLESLQNYRKEWDDKRKEFKNHPYHDFTSHACLSDKSQVLTRFGSKYIKDICVGDEVWTPNGYSKVLKSGPVKVSTKLIKLELSDGRELRCTPEHKIHTINGFELANDIKINTPIYSGKELSCKISSLISMALGLGYRDAITGKTAGHNRDQVTYIEQFGNFIMEKFQKVMTYITKMAIPSIMTYPTWNVKLIQNTNESTLWRELPEETCYHHRSMLENKLRYGITHMKDTCGTANMERVVGKIGSGISVFVQSVVKNLCHLFRHGLSFATTTVKRKTYEDVEELVYDLTIEKNACYQANGILVSNSDSFRYFAVGVQPKGFQKTVSSIIQNLNMGSYW